MPTTITPLSLYYSTAPLATTNGGGATYTNVPVPSTAANGSAFTQSQRVLAYALAAEYLETALYQQAYLHLTGGPLTLTVAGGSSTQVTTATDALGYVYGTGATQANLGVSTSDPIAIYLAEFASIEASHAAFLTSALGGDPYPSTVAFAFGLNTITNSNGGKVAVAQAVYGAELTGVSAYTGAIPSFSAPTTQQYPSYLQIAASILGTEARHTTALAATINAANGNGAIETAPMYNEGHGLDVPLTPDQILNAAGSTGITVPGGTIKSVSGPNGAAIGAANGTTTPTYNGYVYLVTTVAGL